MPAHPCLYPGLRWLPALWLLMSSTLHAAPTITFSCWIPPDVPLYSRVESLFRQAFEELGYEFEMHHRPNQRSLMEARTGTTDGECARTYRYAEQEPDSGLVRVDTMITRTSLEAWSHRTDLELSSVQDLHREPMRIGYVRGHVAVKNIVEQQALPYLIPVANSDNGFKMLSAQRLDLFIGTSVSTRQELEQLDLPNPIYSAGHLMDLRGHAYLHEKHRALAPKLARELSRLLPEGGWTLDP